MLDPRRFSLPEWKNHHNWIFGAGGTVLGLILAVLGLWSPWSASSLAKHDVEDVVVREGNEIISRIPPVSSTPPPLRSGSLQDAPKPTSADDRKPKEPKQNKQPTEAPLQTASVPPKPGTVAIVAPEGSIPGNYQDKNAKRELSVAMSGSLPFASQDMAAFRIEVSHVAVKADDTMRPCRDDPRYSTWQANASLDVRIFSRPQDVLIFAQNIPGNGSACGPEDEGAINASIKDAVVNAKASILTALHNHQQADLDGQ